MFPAHWKVKCCQDLKENTLEFIEAPEIEVTNIKFENTLEVNFLVKDIGYATKSFEDTIKIVASFINPDSDKYNAEVTSLLQLS